MNHNKIVLGLLLSLAGFLTELQGQEVTYRNYDNFENETLRTLKESGAVSTFNSMHNLKRQTLQVRANTLVPVTLKAVNKKPISGEKLVDECSEGIMVVSRYAPKIIQGERVVAGASCVVLTEDGVCVSNYHVFEPIIDSSKELTPLDSIFFVASKSGKIYPITAVLSYNKISDLAIFKIDPHGDKLTTVSVGKDLPAGATIQALTHAYGHLFYYSKGVVARNICGSELNPDTNRSDITADYCKGSSGGPLFDECGNLVGIVSTTQSIYYTEYPQTDLQMVVKTIIPISSVLRLLKQQ